MLTEPADLPDRDQLILNDLHTVRLLTGRQLERARFAAIDKPKTRGSARRRSLGRLQKLGLVTTLDRRIGGERAGSAGLIYTLTASGHRLFNGTATNSRRKPWSIGLLFTQHTLAVSELYVRLLEATQNGTVELTLFQAEPAAWYRTANYLLKPDAFNVFSCGQLEHHYWVELDRGTESLPTLRRKLLTYLDIASVGSGPFGMTPAVLVSVDAPTHRLQAIRQLVAELPSPADRLFEVTSFKQTFTEFGRPPP